MYGRAADDTSGLSRAAAAPRRGPFRSEKNMRRVGAAMRRSANRPPPVAADAYRPPPGSWHDGAEHEARRATMSTERMTVNGIELEVLRRGAGIPVLLLHGMDTVPPQTRFLDMLGHDAEIIAPSSPGFGNTKRPADFDTIYDLVRLYLAVLDELPYERVALLGLSFGGWLAAEIAVASCHRVSKLVLVDPVGIKLGAPETREILDVFNVNPAEVRRRSWHDPAKAPDYDAMSDEELVVHARNWEALCLYAWHPYMYNPQLKHWLGRIRVPTLMLWGASDGVVTPDYGRAYSRLIPGARFELVDEAGHHPELEQPERFAGRVAAFLKG